MLRAFNQFKKNIQSARELGSLFEYLENQNLVLDLSDILRAKIVYGVSALDKLIHELIKIGMIESFLNTRIKTNKFKSFSITLDTYTNIEASISTTFSFPPEYWLEREIVIKHKSMSFQEPTKIAEGLSLIWGEEHKWQKIAQSIGMSEDTLKKNLKVIIDRRNLIVHESDLNEQTGIKNTLEKQEAIDSLNLIDKIGTEIFNLVK